MGTCDLAREYFLAYSKMYLYFLQYWALSVKFLKILALEAYHEKVIDKLDTWYDRDLKSSQLTCTRDESYLSVSLPHFQTKSLCLWNNIIEKVLMMSW